MKNIPQRLTLKELRNMYNVNYKTLKKWLKNVPDLNHAKFGKSGYSSEQIKKIFEFLGEPD
jgi:hypothetical protein